MAQRSGWMFGVAGAALLWGTVGGMLFASASARADARSFAAEGTGLSIEQSCARHVSVAVDPALSGRIAVDATAAHPEEIAQLAVAPAGGAARVGLAPDRRQCWQPDPHGSFEPTLALAVRVPAAFPVQVSEGGEVEYAVGAVGPLVLQLSGEVGAAVDAVEGDARIALSGTGKVAIGRLDAEQLRLDLSGSGDVRVRDGRIGAVRISESGMGEVRIDPTVRDATLSVSGMGRIALGGVTGSMTRAVSGMATITVAGRPVAGKTVAGGAVAGERDDDD